jgi:hypothetical protein
VLCKPLPCRTRVAPAPESCPCVTGVLHACACCLCSLQELRHANIVRYLDVFEIDHDSFATVLEYCKGMDLDRRLKEVTMLPEVEARGIVIQVLSALCHLTGCDTASKKEVRAALCNLPPLSPSHPLVIPWGKGCHFLQ